MRYGAKDTTRASTTADSRGTDALCHAYDAIAQAVGAPAHAGELASLRDAFQARTGAFRPDDPSPEAFDARTRAFWDDVVTAPGLAARFVPDLDPGIAAALGRAHRGLLVVDALEGGAALLRDLWSGAELEVRVLDDAQRVTFLHSESAFDARVVAADPEAAVLVVLPGAFHHPADAMEHLPTLLDAARTRGMGTRDALDALFRMERVLRASSRVKAAFAYRLDGLAAPRAR